MPSVASDSRSKSSKRSGLRPKGKPEPSTPTMKVPVPTSITPATPSPALQHVPDDLSINSVESQPDKVLMVIPDMDYQRLGTWMHEHFDHHFDVKDAYFINHLLKLHSSVEPRTFVNSTPRDLATQLGMTTYTKWLTTIINCVTYLSILLDMTSSIPFVEFMELRSQVHEIIRQSYTDILTPPPTYEKVSPLAIQYGVSPQPMPVTPRMVDSEGHPYPSTAAFSGGIGGMMSHRLNIPKGHNTPTLGKMHL